MTDKKSPTWEEVVGDPLQRKVASDKEESDWDDDTHVPTESQFEDAAVAEAHMDTEEPVVDSLQEENIEASVGPGSQDVVQIHAGNDNLD